MFKKNTYEKTYVILYKEYLQIHNENKYRGRKSEAKKNMS
jgi:hypothetical protein